MPDLRAIPGSYQTSGGRLRPIPGSYTNENVIPNKEALAAIAKIASANVDRAARFAEYAVANRGEDPYDSDEYKIIAEIRNRKTMLEPEQARLRVLFQRMDNLFYPQDITTGGADHWPEGEQPGRVHISDNTPPVYVEIPASLQAYEPIENYVAGAGDPDAPDPEKAEQEAREQAARIENLYFEWKDETEFELMVHQACIVKALYGFTYGKVYWDSLAKRPTVTLIDSPENLYVGWGSSDFSRMDWAIYCYGLSHQSVRELYGLEVHPRQDGEDVNEYFPFVTTGDHSDPLGNVYGKVTDLKPERTRSEYEQRQVEVYDYWYKKPGKARKGQASKSEIWNAIYVGNFLVKNAKHAEYDDLPYVPLTNTYIPGSPYGRPELYDLEQLFREFDERLTNAGQMIASTTDGQRWQLVGPEAPDDLPANAVPQPNKVATPGPGAEIKAIQPFIGQYAAEDFLKRLEAEMEKVSGLNELLLGRAPATILGSSKAIAALVANYEARISIKRKLLYQWRKKVWRMAAQVWESKDAQVKSIIDGHYRIEVKPPELTPRDELENAQKALNLMQNRAWSLRRTMDATGVEDPEAEIKTIREEQTDAALNPAAVQAQATLLATLQSLGVAPPQGSVNQAQNAARTLNPPAPGGQSLNAPENQANSPNTPANAQAPNGAKAVSQSLLQGGEASGRVLTQTPINGGQ